VKVLLVGLGRWGEKHLRVLGELGVEPWVADPAAARRRLAVDAGVAPERVAGDFRVALPHVDAEVIATPADTHAAIAEACLSAGKPCFIEKPLAHTLEAAQALAAMAARASALVQVGHIYRFHPVTETLASLLASGRLGALRYASGRIAGFKRPRTDGGVTQADAIHLFDLFAHLLGEPPRAVTASLWDGLGRGMDDAAVAVVDHGSVRVHVEVGYFTPEASREIVIAGERATAAADFSSGEVRVHDNRHVPAPDGWQAIEGPVEVMKAAGPEPLRREMQSFLEAVTSGRAPMVGIEAGLLALRTVEAARLSSALGRRVSLAELSPPEAASARDTASNTSH
jgi:UDP-N-acetylglucosamine 3-dehydrogenase